MTDPHAKALARIEERLRSGPGELAPAVRAAAIDAAPVADPLAQRYVGTLRECAYKLTDRQLDELARNGWTDGQVFELTVAGGVRGGQATAGCRACRARRDGWARPAGWGRLSDAAGSR